MTSCEREAAGVVDAPRPPVGGHQAQQEDDGLAAEQQQDEREDEQRATDERIPAPGHREGCEDEKEGDL